MMGVPTLFYPITEWTPVRFPIFFGEGTPGQPVSICQSGTGLVVAQTTVDENGNWLTQSDIALPLGPYSVSAYYDLSQGYAPNLAFHVGDPSPMAGNGPSESDNSPVLTSLTIVDSLRPWLTGTAPPNATVVIAHSGGSVYYASVGADSNGYWEATPTTDLVVDANNWVDLALIANDAGGNALSPWVGVQLTVLLTSTGDGAMADGTPPVINSPANNSSVQTVRPTFTGKAAPNARIGVHNDAVNVYYGDCYADANGNWTYPFPQDLAPGQVTLKFGQFSQSARLSADTAHTLNIALSGSGNALPSGSAPQLTSPTTVNSLRPLLTGKAAPNAIVYVYLEGGSVLFGKPQADSNGDWHLQLSQDIYSTSTPLVLAEFNANGALMSGWTAVTLTMSTAPTSNTLPSGSAPQLTSPTTVNSLRPLLTGKAAPNAIVYVYLEGGSVLFGKPQADSNGDWNLQLSQDIYSTSTPLVLAEFNANGALMSGWTAVTLTMSTAPTSNTLPSGSAPQLTSPTTVNSLRPLLTGKAAPNAIVYVYLEGGSVLFGKPQADSNGDWHLQLSQDIYSTSTPLVLAEFNANGALMSGWTAVTLTMSTAPTSNTLPSGSAPQLTSPTTVNSLRPLLTGKAAPNAIVYVYLEGGSVLFGKPQADSNGDWHLQLSQDIYSTSTPLALAEFNANGALMSGWTAVTLTMSTAPTSNTLPSGSAPQLTSPTTVNSLRPLLTGKAAPNAIVYVYLEGGSVLFGKPQADSNGDWNLQLSQDIYSTSTPLSLGEFNANGALMSGWTAVTLTMSTAPTSNALPSGSPPQLTSPTTVNSLRPLLTGKAAPNAIVYVYLEGGSVLFGKPQADSNGDWNLQLSQDIYSTSTPLSLGEFNANGALMSGWTAVTLTMSTAPTSNTLPSGSAPQLTSPTTVNSLRPLLTGKAAPNAIVYVYLEGGSVLFGKPQADSNGDWNLQLSQDIYSTSTPLALAEFNANGGQVSGWTAVILTMSKT